MANRVTRALERAALEFGRKLYATPYLEQSLVASPKIAPLSHAKLLDTMLAYYWGGGLYDLVAEAAGYATEARKPLRNPVRAFVSFYEDHLLPNPVEVAVDEEGIEAIAPLIAEVWKRSNWVYMTRELGFNFGVYGELLIKVQQKEDGNPYFVLIDPRYIPEGGLSRDARGFITWLRTDTPTKVRNTETGVEDERMVTEVWEPGRYRKWTYTKKLVEGNGEKATPLDKIPGDAEFVVMRYEGDSIPADADASQYLTVDFVPVAYARFGAEGGERGMPGFFTALEEIDESNALATRLHALGFRYGHPDKQLVGVGKDAQGRPIPPPPISDDDLRNNAGIREIEVDGETMWLFPSGWSLEYMVAQLAYDELLNIVNAQVEAVRQDHLPELYYYELSARNGGADSLSGKAIRYLLEPAISRAITKREYALDAIKRANMMALTLGQRAGLPGYEESAIGTFEKGGFEHGFKEQDIIPAAAEEKASTFGTLSGKLPAPVAAELAGYDEQQVEAIRAGEAEKQAREDEVAEREKEQGGTIMGNGNGQVTRGISQNGAG